MYNKSAKRPKLIMMYWLLSLPLLLISASIVLVYDFFCIITFENDFGRAQYSGIMLSICLLLTVITIFLPWLLRNQKIKQRMLALRWPITILMCCFVVFLMIDGPPVKNDYSEKDIIPDSTQVRESYDLLKPLIGDRETKIDVDRAKFVSYDFLANIHDHEAEVINAWDSIAEERKIIETLSGFDVVIGLNPQDGIRFDTPFIQFTSFLNIQSIYLAYAALNIRKGQTRKGFFYLNHLYSVARKGAVSTPILIHKILWISGVINKTIEGLYLIQSLDYADSQTRALIAEHFTPLTKDEISLEKAFIGEYLFGESYTQSIEPGSFLESFSTFGFDDEEVGWMKRALSTSVYYFAFQENRMSADKRYFVDSLIAWAKFSVSDINTMDNILKNYRRNPTLRNLAGWAFWVQQAPDFTKYVDRLLNVKVKSDLLTIHLRKSSGPPVDLKDYYTGKSYEVREANGLLSIAGADGLFDSDDDVILGKRRK